MDRGTVDIEPLQLGTSGLASLGIMLELIT
jgi:hypothetical protein